MWGSLVKFEVSLYHLLFAISFDGTNYQVTSALTKVAEYHY